MVGLWDCTQGLPTLLASAWWWDWSWTGYEETPPYLGVERGTSHGRGLQVMSEGKEKCWRTQPG